MQRHRLICGAGLLTCFLFSACGTLGAGSESAGNARSTRAATERGAFVPDRSGHLPTRVEELLIGRFPGVTVIRGANGQMRVRVRSTSMQGSQDPLWVIDGMPIEASASDHTLESIDPTQVSRIVVLKDAGSTAIYGARGANGVIELTTRRGTITEPPFPRQQPPPRVEPPRTDPPADPEI